MDTEHSHGEELADWKAPDANAERLLEKQKRWDEITAEIETITDGLVLELMKELKILLLD